MIGGGVAKAGALLFDPLREALASYAGLDFLRGLRVLPLNSVARPASSERPPLR